MIKFAFQLFIFLAGFLGLMFLGNLLMPILTNPIVFSIWFGFIALVILKLASRWINE
jgi:hypothetical protein